MLLEGVFFHQVPERAIGDPKQLGRFSLDAATLIESSLQQRTFDGSNIVFHAHALG